MNIKIQKIIKSLIFFSVSIIMSSCFFGGLVVKGGRNFEPSWHAEASITHGSAYKIVCEIQSNTKENQNSDGDAHLSPEQISKNQNLKVSKKKLAVSDSEKKKTETTNSQGSLFKLLEPEEYKGGCEQTGQSSVFYLLNLWPLTDPIDPNYAIASAVQRLEGDTMVRIHLWHEVHYYGLVGRVFVLYARGDVVRYNDK